jgi:hypothetical protein
MRSPSSYAILIASLPLLCLACSDDSTSPPTPRALEIVQGDGQQSRTGIPLPTDLRVRVVGTDDQPVAGAVVQWGVTIGSAAMTPTQVATNNDGLAQTSVVLQSISDVFVSAVVPGVLPATFHLYGLDPCDFNAWPQITVGTSVTGTLQPSDCEGPGGHFNDSYPFYTETHQAVILEMQSSAFDPLLKLFSNEPWHYLAWDTVNATRHVRRKAIVPAGWYALVASSIDSRATGGYTARVTSTAESQESCEFVMIMVGATTTQNLAPTDCADPSGRPEDRFWLVLYEGETATITQSSRHVTPHIRVLRNGEVIAEADGAETGPAMLSVTSDDLHDYWVHVSSSGTPQLGEYTLFITRGEDATASVSTPRELGPLGRLNLRDRTLLGVRPGAIGRDAAASPR